MVRVYADGEYGCGGSDEEDVGKMPDQVGHDEDGCKGRKFHPTLHLGKTQEKEKTIKKRKNPTGAAGNM